MLLSEKHFQILDTLDSQEISSQRQLAESTGISLGQINYVLKQFLEKGMIKIGNFRKNPHKIGYTYLLTPKGIEQKSQLAAHFIMAKLKEYNNIREKLAKRLIDIENKSHSRIIFIGPEVVKEFVDSIIKERSLNLVLIAHCKDWHEIKSYEPESFDMIVESDSDQETTAKKLMEFPDKMVMSLW